MPAQPKTHESDGTRERQTTIRFSQVDAAGIVFYPRYFEMIFRAFTATAIPAPPFVIRTEFLRPNRLGDRLTLVHVRGRRQESWSIRGSMDEVEYFRVCGEPTDGRVEGGPTAFAFRTSPEAVQDWTADGHGRLLLSRYFEGLSDAIEEWFETRLRTSLRELHVDGAIGIPTVSFRTTCRALPSVGDRVCMAIRPHRIGRRSLQLSSWLERDDDWLICSEQVIVFVQMQADGFRSRPVPENIRRRLEAELECGANPEEDDRVAT